MFISSIQNPMVKETKHHNKQHSPIHLLNEVGIATDNWQQGFMLTKLQCTTNESPTIGYIEHMVEERRS